MNHQVRGKLEGLENQIQINIAPPHAICSRKFPDMVSMTVEKCSNPPFPPFNHVKVLTLDQQY